MFVGGAAGLRIGRNWGVEVFSPNCSAKIEKEVGELDGVQSSVVNLMKQTLTINVAPVAANTIASQIETIVHSDEPGVEVQDDLFRRRRSVLQVNPADV